MEHTFKTCPRGSETGKIRKIVLPYIAGKCGVDLGYGGDPIIHTAICIDQPNPYANVGDYPQHLKGDASKLNWFQNGVLDYVYSSHLLEDFADPKPVIKEWLRVLKVGGLLILLLPDEQRYRECCKKAGHNPNSSHKNPDISLRWMKEFFYREFPSQTTSLNESDSFGDPYCFYMILKKEK